MSDNKCVCCGNSIPEGSQVCPNCIRKTLGVETVDKESERKVIRINKFYDMLITGSRLLQFSCSHCFSSWVLLSDRL